MKNNKNKNTEMKFRSLGLSTIAFAGMTPLMLSASVMASDITIIHAGELLAIPGEKPLKQQTLVMPA